MKTLTVCLLSLLALAAFSKIETEEEVLILTDVS